MEFCTPNRVVYSVLLCQVPYDLQRVDHSVAALRNYFRVSFFTHSESGPGVSDLAPVPYISELWVCFFPGPLLFSDFTGELEGHIYVLGKCVPGKILCAVSPHWTVPALGLLYGSLFKTPSVDDISNSLVIIHISHI